MANENARRLVSGESPSNRIGCDWIVDKDVMWFESHLHVSRDIRLAG